MSVASAGARSGASRVVPGECLRRLAAVTLLAAPGALMPGMNAGIAAQEAPPEPLPLRPLELPPITERTLSNGARVLVVPNREMPLVTVNLVLPGGQGVDSAGLEGVGLLTASLLESGTPERSFTEIVEAFDGMGASLQASASADWTEVSLTALTDSFDPALELMADLVMHPTFPGERVEAVRRQAVTALEAQRSQASSLAPRVVSRVVYGDHRYGKQTTEATLSAIDRAALLDHHARWYRPGSALFVVAGDVEPDGVVAKLESAFAEWNGGATPEIEYGGAPEPEPRIVLVHKPGSVQAEIRIAHLLPAGDDDDWTALQVAGHYLGSQPSGRLFSVLREERGYAYGASSTLERRADRGLFAVAFATRNAVAGEALGVAREILEEVRTGEIPPEALARTRSFLTGAFPLQSETPQQVAGRVATNRLLGLPPEEIERYRERVAEMTVDEVQGALRRALDPARATIVVVGDATVLQPQLVSLGPVEVEDATGKPISMADLVATGRSEALDATALTPGEWEYVVTLQGQRVGTLSRRIEGSDSLRTVTSELQLGPQTMGQSVTFTAAGFAFRSSLMSLSDPAGTMSGDVRLEGDRITGVLDTGVGTQTVDLAAPEGVLVSDMLEIALWLVDLNVGKELSLPVASVSNGVVSNATLRVEEREEITVPAGTFEVFRVVITGPDAQTIWVRTDAPHLPIRVSPEGQPITIELAGG